MIIIAINDEIFYYNHLDVTIIYKWPSFIWTEYIWWNVHTQKPEKDLVWSEPGAEGASRFLGRVWRIIYKWHERLAGAAAGEFSAEARAQRHMGQLDIAEPFKGLFTQGMVTHETYKAPDGSWLSPGEIKQVGANIVTLDNQPVTLGRIEKMSKSKKNVVDPDPMFDQYGADAVRWFMLSDLPPERDLEWSEAGIEGTWRFVNRIWRLFDTLERKGLVFER